MHRSIITACLLVFAFTTGCATNKQWSVTGGAKDAGLVRVSYEYQEYREPEVSEQQAQRLALNRCEGWGFDDAQPIAGQLRRCSNTTKGNCDQWTVTREYQCTRDVAQANLLAR